LAVPTEWIAVPALAQIIASVDDAARLGQMPGIDA
jgi:hypothetical protein